MRSQNLYHKVYFATWENYIPFFHLWSGNISLLIWIIPFPLSSSCYLSIWTLLFVCWLLFVCMFSLYVYTVSWEIGLDKKINYTQIWCQHVIIWVISILPHSSLVIWHVRLVLDRISGKPQYIHLSRKSSYGSQVLFSYFTCILMEAIILSLIVWWNTCRTSFYRER